MNYSILINTCDKFEDCWNPFFKLWSIYWPNCKGNVYLNTEYKDYRFPGLNIIPIKGCVGKKYKGKFATWSQCLKWALDNIDTDIVLYMQEDYFLTGIVKNELVEHYVEWLSFHPEISCIHLTDQGIPGEKDYGSEHLFEGRKDFFSYLSCQAAIWHKKDLLSLIREYETAWNFEWWGSRRAQYGGYKFLTIDKSYLYINGPIIPYLCTGIIGGKWYPPVVSLFKKHDIHLDFNQRGFYNPNKKATIKERLKTKWSIYKRWRSIIEIIKLKRLK